MPPSAARTIYSSSIRSRSCIVGTHRSFTSTCAARQVDVGPESPKYIKVPQPPQQTAPYTPVVKGSLPVPRNIFINRSKLDKASPEFLKAVTPEPSARAAVKKGPHASRVAYKQRLAALRRNHLRESVVVLHERKKKQDSYLAQRGAARRKEQRRLIHAPEREDEYLTNPSVSQAVRDFLAGKRAGLTQAHIQAKKKNLQVREAAKTLQRRDALHTLYMHARNFIVTEEQLNKSIDDAFGSEERPVSFSVFTTDQGRSIWARDRPKNTTEMLDKTSRMGRSAMEVNAGYSGQTRNRITKIAEELTGGKI